MKKLILAALASAVLCLQACDKNMPVADVERPAAELLTHSDNSWYIESAAKVDDIHAAMTQIRSTKGAAKNIILFIGDGMSIATTTAARILDGQQKGMHGEENSLSYGNFPFTGLMKTYNVDAQTPDSAGTMTAIISGVKTDVGVIGVDEDVVLDDCSTLAGNQLITALELAEIAGLSTGIVSTARITHATPAAAYAKSPSRDWEDVSNMPLDAVVEGCEDIASQLVNFEANLEAQFQGLDIDGIEVVMGGGRRHFLPVEKAANSVDASSEVEGDRTDGRNLIAEWQAIYPTGTYIAEQGGFDTLDVNSQGPVFGLFNESHMLYEADRANDIAGEPSLTEMTSVAVDILDKNPRGYFLVVESGRIDHGHHANNAYNALTDTIEFSRAIQAAVDNSNPDETLIIVTADHGHVFTIAGYPKRGNPILGKVIDVGSSDLATDIDGMPYTTLGYANGPGFHDFGAETNADKVYYTEPFAGRTDLTNIDTESSGFHQEAMISKRSETHSGEDVAVYATGPGGHLVSGTQEQSGLFHIMNFAADLVGKAQASLAN
ncbi:MAG: alkaline phosphatase [Porticoccaceae bacterium]|nr:alkaline phosphatase [Porticoccaceae bacterium]